MTKTVSSGSSRSGPPSQVIDQKQWAGCPEGMKPALVHGSRPTYVAELIELLRVLVVAGVSVGIVVIGLGSRLAMFALRLTSPDDVVGVVSDEGFLIGRITLSGTYNLLVIGAAVGVIGAAACVAVAPWLIGPNWFRRLTVGLTAGALVGSLLIHSDGKDFTALGPLWLARSASSSLFRPCRPWRWPSRSTASPRQVRGRPGASDCGPSRWFCSPSCHPAWRSLCRSRS
jgi:hypothetical protein